jgi:undecaprenyl-diphosphatase
VEETVNTPAVAVAAEPPVHRRNEWRDLVLTPVGDGSSRRRAADGLGLVVAGCLAAGSVALISSGPVAEIDLAQTLTSVPHSVHWLLTTLWYLGSYGVIALIALIALASRRLALARDTVVAGFGAWVLGLGLAGWLGSTAGRPSTTIPFPSSATFPLIQLAAAVAVAVTVLPYLTRPTRRLFLGVLALGALAALMRGDGLPLVVVASIAVGWGVAAGVHLAFGSPTGMPDSRRVENALIDLGFDVSAVTPVQNQVLGVARFTGSLEGRRVDISVYDRDAADAQFLAKAWRFLWYRDSPRFAWSRVSQVEHEAFLTMSAAQAGTPTATVIGAGIAPDGKAAALITSPPPGRPLAGLQADGVTPTVLDALFSGLARLRSTRISHGNLSGDVVIVADDGTVALEDFRLASTSADPDRLDRDVANAMVSATLATDVAPTVDAVVRTLGEEPLSAALPHLQPGALSRANRARLHHRKKLLDQLRDAGAERLGVKPPELVKVTRVSWGTLSMSVGAAVGVYLVAKQFAGVDIGTAISSASVAWVLVALVLGAMPNAAQALSVTGSVAVPLPYGPTVALELSDNFTGLVGGSVGSSAGFIRFFQRRGLAASVAVVSTMLISVAAVVSEGVLLGVCYLLVRHDFTLPARSTHGSSHGGARTIFVVLLVALAVGILVVALVPRFRRRVVDVLRKQLEAVRDNFRELLSHPAKLVALFGGALLAELIFATVLGASLLAYGVSLSLAMLVVINTLASVLAAFAPTPGGMGVIEGGLIAGMTAAGVPTSAAVPAVLISRSCTCYLPPIWGYLCLVWLRKNEYL